MNSLPAFSAPTLPAQRAPRRTAKTAPRCALTRRQTLQLAALTLASTALPESTRAESTYEKNVRLNVERVSLGMHKAAALKDTASQWKGSLEEDDELYVLRFIPIWLEPARGAMRKVGDQTEVDVGNRPAVQQEAARVLGHLFELKAEAKGRSKDGVLRELDEYVESCEKFLKFPGIARFVR